MVPTCGSIHYVYTVVPSIVALGICLTWWFDFRRYVIPSKMEAGSPIEATKQTMHKVPTIFLASKSHLKERVMFCKENYKLARACI